MKKIVTFDEGKASIVSEGQISPYSKKSLQNGQPNKYHSKNNSDLCQLAKSCHQNR